MTGVELYECQQCGWLYEKNVGSPCRMCENKARMLHREFDADPREDSDDA